MTPRRPGFKHHQALEGGLTSQSSFCVSERLVGSGVHSTAGRHAGEGGVGSAFAQRETGAKRMRFDAMFWKRCPVMRKCISAIMLLLSLRNKQNVFVPNGMPLSASCM